MSIELLLMTACFVAAAACFAANQKYRAAVDEALAAGEKSPVQVPERIFSYDAAYIDSFKSKAGTVRTASGRRALAVYVRPILIWLDVGFAISLSLAAALFWKVSPHFAANLPYIQSVAWFCLVMSVAYGVTDVAEDLWLARLLDKTSVTREWEGTIACTLTRLKMGTITLSLVGVLAFAIFSKVFARQRSSG